ncbi:MAG: fasciclin domain-containing protein [Erythrobacter sp.]|nr:fasciclin domain-containing protein [Erythrobacter sp.]
MNRTMIALLAAPALLLAGCGDSSEEATEAPVAVSTQTLAAMIAGDSDISAVSQLLSDAGLQGLFDGNAPYTVLAPTNAAFAAVEEALPGDDQRAARVAVIREHVLPGYLTTADIEAAVRNAPDGSVQMQTMGGAPLTFTLEDNTIGVTAADGSHALLQAGELLASNGVAIRVDGVLKNLDAQ